MRQISPNIQKLETVYGENFLTIKAIQFVGFDAGNNILKFYQIKMRSIIQSSNKVILFLFPLLLSLFFSFFIAVALGVSRGWKALSEEAYIVFLRFDVGHLYIWLAGLTTLAGYHQQEAPII